MLSKKLIKRFTSVILSAIIMLSLLFTVSCGKDDNEETGKPVIAVTIVPEATFVKAVCGENVEIVTLVPPGNSPENYEPTPLLMEQFEAAALYFSIGVPTEEANIIPNIGSKTKVISLQSEVETLYAARTFDSGERDPHIWLSPKRVKVMIDVIAREMCTLDPENPDTYNANAALYKEQLDTLDTQITTALEGVVNRKFIVYHPAFGYLADDYGLTMYALEEEGKEATATHLQEMIDLAKAENIKVIFYQDEIDSSQSEAFAEEIGGKTTKLAPLAADYIDNLKRMADLMAETMK
ncbi:MAG: zinc ABC transporter substrate-binding protein [Eubacteriales bacterium]|nr:zinc ABC transporter substrate-binding protein [Eubacteriales bacterium]